MLVPTTNRSYIRPISEMTLHNDWVMSMFWGYWFHQNMFLIQRVRITATTPFDSSYLLPHDKVLLSLYSQETEKLANSYMLSNDYMSSKR